MNNPNNNKKYWYIKIHKNDDKFDEEEQYCLDTKSIGVGFRIRDCNLDLTEAELKNKCIEEIGIDDYKHAFKSYNTFINVMKNNDFVFLCKGVQDILYMGEIDGNYYYDTNNRRHPHRRKLKNIIEFSAIAPKRMLATIYEV